MATFCGIWRISRWIPPSEANTPTRTSGRPKRACSAATMTSQLRASSKPPPSA